MTLYDIDGDKLKPSKIDFDRESKIQSLTQNNLEELFNLKFAVILVMADAVITEIKSENK